MGIFWGIIRFIVGGIFGVASALALSPAVAAFNDTQGGSVWVFWVVIAIGALLGTFAPSIRRAFGRGFLLLGVSVLALPLSTMLLSGRVAGNMASESGNDAATLVGAGIAGTMMTGAAAFIGFFLGAIFIIIGLVLALGGRREVVVVERYATPTTGSGRQEPRL